MAADIEETMKMMSKQATAFTLLLLAKYTKEIGLMVREMVKALRNFQMAAFMKETI